MKYLKINDNTFLFNVVEDPLERANLKERQPEVYKRLVEAYHEWQTTMLPLDPLSGTHFFRPSQLADHYSPQDPAPAPGAGRGRGPGTGPGQAHPGPDR
jgi:hypothetical protein